MYNNLLAQVGQPLGNLSGIGNIGNPSNPVATFASVLSSTIGVLTVVAGLYFIFTLILGAIQLISAGGDKGAVEEARRKMTNGVLGVVIVIAAMFIVDLVFYLLGIPSLLNIGQAVNLVKQ